MRVLVSEDVVHTLANTGEVQKLHRLFGYACEGRHVVIFDPPSAPDHWLSQSDPATCNTYKNALKQMARSSSALPRDVATVHIKLNVVPKWDDVLAELPIDDALAVLDEPLGILVENSDNDWNFLLGIMRVSERERTARIVQKSWAKPLHGGGSTLKQQLDIRLKKNHEGLRTFVFFDSDRRHPDELAQAWKPTGQENCAGFQTEQLVLKHLPKRYWMLKRRFIESYMPESRMPDSVSTNTKEAFFRLSQPGRWYFNMKGGFVKDNHVNNAPRCQTLYKAVSGADKTALNNGFGSSLADQYKKAVSEEFIWDDEARQEADEALPRLMRLF